MSLVESLMVPLGSPAPGFALVDAVSRKTFSLESYAGKPLLVTFLSNHCPYARHVEAAYARLANEFMEKGVASVAICSNDASSYPDDAPEKLAEQAARIGMKFPYLVDDTQEVAKSYKAMCTPDFYLFDAQHKLFYRGRFDSSRPEQDTPVNGSDLRAALERLLAGQEPPELQYPSMGCNIKWKPGNEPDYYG